MIPEIGNEKMLRLAVVVDPLGSWEMTPEEEVLHIEEILNAVGVPVELIPQTFYGGYSEEIENTKVDILVIDYGGMTFGAMDTTIWQIRSACKWAQEHPSSLLIIWSSFTAEIYERELSEEFGKLTNFLPHFTGMFNADFIKTWFGLERE